MSVLDDTNDNNHDIGHASYNNFVALGSEVRGGEAETTKLLLEQS